MAYGRRKKGGQRLMEMSKAATKKRIAKKNTRVGGKKYVTPLPKAKKAAPKATKPKSQFSRAQLNNMMSEARGMGNLAKGLSKDIGDAQTATKAAITVASLPIGGGALAGVKAARAAKGAKGLSQAAKGAGKGKPVRSTPSRPSGTPKRPSGSGSKTPQKPTGSGPRGGTKSATSTAKKAARTQRKTVRTQRRSQTQAERTAARKQRQAAKDRKERVGSGQSRMRRQRQNAGLARGRNTMRRNRNKTGAVGYR
tara:strand:- start:5520 stop:6278 length:759 start_codon:yes stop_codon:yes gene_type:complete